MDKEDIINTIVFFTALIATISVGVVSINALQKSKNSNKNNLK